MPAKPLDDLDVRILTEIRARGQVKPGEIAKRFEIARMTAYRRLTELVQRKLVRRKGERGRDVVHVLAPISRSWPLKGLNEHDAFGGVEGTLKAQWQLGKDDGDALSYVFMEMVNNAIDHSGGTKVKVEIDSDEGLLRLVIADDGVGAFERVRSERKLESIRDAILQIEKGKQTTMPERHSGEGLFFSSKIARRFRVEANGRAWLVDNAVEGGDSTLGNTTWRSGTKITAWFVPGAVPKLESVFGAYTDESGAFSKTKTTVKLAEQGNTFLSRSEARRVAAGLEKFAEATLDFKGVERVGQGFVDELFRVFARAHPEVRLQAVHMSEDVRFMVGRGAPVVASLPSLPRVESLRDGAFAAMEPVRVLKASELVAVARTLTSPVARGVLSTRALALVGGDTRERLGTLVTDVERVLREEDSVNDASAVVARIASTPKLWRWFVDDDAIERFFALSPAERVALWGAPELHG